MHLLHGLDVSRYMAITSGADNEFNPRYELSPEDLGNERW